MYWSDFEKFLRRNCQPYAKLRIFPPSKAFPNKVTILDYHYPRRKEMATYGWALAAWYNNSMVCTAVCENGELPLKGSEGYFDERTGTQKGMMRGCTGVVKVLLDHGTLRPTREVWEFMDHNGALEHIKEYRGKLDA